MTKKLFIALFFFSLSVDAQTYFDKTQKEIEVGTFLSTSGQNPFWLRSNQYGIVPLESQGIQFRGRLTSAPPSTKAPPSPGGGGGKISPPPKEGVRGKVLSFNYAFEVVANVGKTNQFLIPEAFAAVKWKAFEFYAGRRREIIGLADSTLSSGSYIWSGNALPIPKVQLSIPEYTSIMGKGLISIKGSYAHGWFDNGYVNNFYLHQKTFYGRLGKPNWKVKFYGGFNHQVQWGGKPATPFIEVSPTGENRLITKYPTGWGAYYQVVTGQSLNKDQAGDALIEEGIPYNEAFNRAGNHLGTVDIGAEVALDQGTILLYRQSIYEDGSLFYLNNITDGLLGFSYKSTRTGYGIKHVVFEYLKTSNQGGKTGSGNTIGQLRGGDNYFNNSLYRNAWTYNGNVIGNPFLTPVSAIKKSNLDRALPASVIESLIINNRVHAFSMSMASHHKFFDGISRVSVSRNFGIYGRPIDFTNFSFYQEAIFPWRTNYVVTASLGLDGGKLYGTQLGILVRIKRVF